MSGFSGLDSGDGLAESFNVAFQLSNGVADTSVVDEALHLFELADSEVVLADFCLLSVYCTLDSGEMSLAYCSLGKVFLLLLFVMFPVAVICLGNAVSPNSQKILNAAPIGFAAAFLDCSWERARP